MTIFCWLLLIVLFIAGLAWLWIVGCCLWNRIR